MKKYEQMHMQGMGSFNWFKIAAWLKEGREKAIRQAEKLVKKIKEHGYPDHSAVMWLSSGKPYHRNLNKKTPWECFKKNGKLMFDFDAPNEKFWKLWRLWLQIHKKQHLKKAPIFMMREDYCWYPFANNINGIDGINSEEALDVIHAYIRKAVKIYMEVFPSTPMSVPWNEPAHYGSGAKFHEIMYEHESVWEDVLKPLGCKLKDIWCDLTMCEGSAGELIEVHDCVKPGACDRNGVHGKDGQNRKILGIKHNFTTLGDFNQMLPNGRTRLENILASANHWRLYTEDGGGTVNDGKYLAGPFKIPCGNAEQQYEMMKVLCKKHLETGKLLRFGTFPHEALFYDKGKNLFIPDYRPRNINWRRIRNGVLKACREMLGE